MIKYSNRVPFLGLYCRKKYGTAAKKRHNMWITINSGAANSCGKLLTFAGRAGLVPLAAAAAARPRWRGMLTTTARARAPAPLAACRRWLGRAAAARSRRSSPAAPLALSCAPPAPQKRDFPPRWRVRPSPRPAPLDTIETSATFCSAKCRYSVILRAERKHPPPPRPPNPAAAGWCVSTPTLHRKLQPRQRRLAIHLTEHLF